MKIKKVLGIDGKYSASLAIICGYFGGK